MKWNPINDTDLLLDRVGRIIDHKVQKAEALKQGFPQVLRSWGDVSRSQPSGTGTAERTLLATRPVQTALTLQDRIICTSKN